VGEREYVEITPAPKRVGTTSADVLIEPAAAPAPLASATSDHHESRSPDGDGHADKSREVGDSVDSASVGVRPEQAHVHPRGNTQERTPLKLTDERLAGSEPADSHSTAPLASLKAEPEEKEHVTLEMWRTAALAKDRTRRAIRERVMAGENQMDIADDFGVPLAFVSHLASWQLFSDESASLKAETLDLTPPGCYKPQLKKLRERCQSNIFTVSEPYPGVTKTIVRQLLAALELAERAALLASVEHRETTGLTSDQVILAWLGYWRDQMPAQAVAALQDILGTTS
jgi:DNA-directed RNA polymerase specialized sigma24 family protein